MYFFGQEIQESKWAMAVKKQRLARKYDYLHSLNQVSASCNGDQMDIDGPTNTAENCVGRASEHTLTPLSDEWFADLDQSFNNIDKLLEELQQEGTQSSQQDYHHIMSADQCLSEMQGDLTQCLTTLRAENRHPESKASERGDFLLHASGDYHAGQMYNEESGHDDVEALIGSDAFFARTPKRFCHSDDLGASLKLTASKSPPSPGENVMKQLFKWWRPCGSNCERHIRRTGDDRKTEVDGLIQ